MEISTAIKAKGDRLLAEGRIRRLTGNVYEVEGDNGKYITWIADAELANGGCDCKAGKSGIFCSHVYTASVYELANPVPKLANVSSAGTDLSDPFDIYDR